MDTQKFLDLKLDFEREGAIFCYSGPITHDILTSIAHCVREKVRLEDGNDQVAKKVFATFIESVQNICWHAAEEAGEERHGIVVVGRRGAPFYIKTGNIVTREGAALLKTKLEKLAALSREELDEYYKEERQKSKERPGRGAGLGLIVMARHAGGEMSYDFRDLDPDRIFYIIEVVI